MNKKEIIKKIYEEDNSIPGRNIMGCLESWYNSYYCIKETFSRNEVEQMSIDEINRLIKLADNITEALY